MRPGPSPKPRSSFVTGGEIYEAIGKVFGFSRGQAHHLVKWAQYRRILHAQEVARPPGHTGPASPDRRLELLSRLRLDFCRVRHVIDNRIDFTQGAKRITDLRGRLDQIKIEFEEGCNQLEEPRRRRKRSGPKFSKAVGRNPCSQVEASFKKLLCIALWDP